MGLTEEQTTRWVQVLGHVAEVLPDSARVLVDSADDELAATFADRLAHTLSAAGRHNTRLARVSPALDEDHWFSERGATSLAIADGPHWRGRPPGGQWDVSIWLRTAAPGPGEGDRESGVDIAVDLRDRGWPVIRYLARKLGDRDLWHLSEARAFFATRASTWDTKFGDDLPVYTAAIAEARLGPGVVLDVGCGTGRALPLLRHAAGPEGAVLGIDATPQMLAAARAAGRGDAATLLIGDARHLPIATGSSDAVFAAGLLTHLPDAEAALRELARVTRPGGRLALFHPTGRAALAARHGHTLRPDEPLAEAPLRASTQRTGWRLELYDDPADRFLAVATRV